MTAAWHAVRTAPRREWLAHDQLGRRDIGRFLPHWRTTASHAGKTLPVKRPVFSRYLFAMVERDDTFAVTSAPGVEGVLRGGRDGITAAQMGALMQRCDGEGAVIDVPLANTIGIGQGDTVEVVRGPFQGATGTVLRVSVTQAPGRRLLLRRVSVYLRVGAGRIQADLPADMVAPVRPP